MKYCFNLLIAKKSANKLYLEDSSDSDSNVKGELNNGKQKFDAKSIPLEKNGN